MMMMHYIWSTAATLPDWCHPPHDVQSPWRHPRRSTLSLTWRFCLVRDGGGGGGDVVVGVAGQNVPLHFTNRSSLAITRVFSNFLLYTTTIMILLYHNILNPFTTLMIICKPRSGQRWSAIMLTFPWTPPTRPRLLLTLGIILDTEEADKSLNFLYSILTNKTRSNSTSMMMTSSLFTDHSYNLMLTMFSTHCGCVVSIMWRQHATHQGPGRPAQGGHWETDHDNFHRWSWSWPGLWSPPATCALCHTNKLVPAAGTNRSLEPSAGENLK